MASLKQPILSLSEIEQAEKQGMTDSEIAREYHVSRQYVWWIRDNYSSRVARPRWDGEASVARILELRGQGLTFGRLRRRSGCSACTAHRHVSRHLSGAGG